MAGGYNSSGHAAQLMEEEVVILIVVVSLSCGLDKNRVSGLIDCDCWPPFSFFSLQIGQIRSARLGKVDRFGGLFLISFASKAYRLLASCFSCRFGMGNRNGELKSVALISFASKAYRLLASLLFPADYGMGKQEWGIKIGG